METQLSKPVPRPRKINQCNNDIDPEYDALSSQISPLPPLRTTSTDSNSDCWSAQQSSAVSSTDAKFNKPTPLPRKTIATKSKLELKNGESIDNESHTERRSSQTMETNQFEDNFCCSSSSSSSSLNLEEIPDKPGLPSLSQCQKLRQKGTINLFQRDVVPFDNEFESMIQSATLNPVSPRASNPNALNSPTEDDISFGSEKSTPASSPVVLAPPVPRRKPTIEPPIPSVEEKDEPEEDDGEIYSLPVDLNRFSSRNFEKPVPSKEIVSELPESSSSSTEDLVYEAISSYSSSGAVLIPTPQPVEITKIESNRIEDSRITENSADAVHFPSEKPSNLNFIPSLNLNEGSAYSNRPLNARLSNLNRISADNPVYMSDTSNGNNSSTNTSRSVSVASNKDITVPVRPTEISYKPANGHKSTPDILLEHSSNYSSSSSTSDHSCRTSSAPSSDSRLSSDSSHTAAITEIEKQKEKQLVNIYDEVAIEDGQILVQSPPKVIPRRKEIIEDQENSELNNSLTSRHSLVKLFDPLCDNNKVVEPNPPSPPLDLNDPWNRYEYIDADNDNSSLDSPKLPSRNTVENPSGGDEEYEIVRPIESQREDKGSQQNYIKRNSKGQCEDSNSETSPAKRGVDFFTKHNFVRSFSSRLKSMNPIKEEKADGKVTPDKNSSSRHSSGNKERPKLMPNLGNIYGGELFRPIGLSKREFAKKRAAISQGKLTFYNDKQEPVSEVPLDKVVVVSTKDDHKVHPNAMDLKCFEFGIAHWKHSSLILATGSKDSADKECVESAESCRSKWMQKYVETFVVNFPLKVTKSFERAGWCYIKVRI